MAEPERVYADVAASDCAIAFGIPSSYEQFCRAERTGKSDLVRMLSGGWQEYRYAFFDTFSSIVPLYRKTGAKVLVDTTLEEFSGVLRTHRAIILFSHWNCEAVEFTDGMKPVREMMSAVPRDFSGILDLCVCHPLSLVRMLHAKRPACLVKFTHKPARALYWLHLYKIVFDILAIRGRSNYLDALESAINGLRRRDAK